jgi:hypothetical protein
MREVSVIMRKKTDMLATTMNTRNEGSPSVIEWNISYMEVRPKIKARLPSVKKYIGSAKTAKVASRAAPMPSNELPISMAPSIWKNRESPSR